MLDFFAYSSSQCKVLLSPLNFKNNSIFSSVTISVNLNDAPTSKSLNL